MGTLGSRKEEPRYEGTTKSPPNASAVPFACSSLMVKRNGTRSPPAFGVIRIQHIELQQQADGKAALGILHFIQAVEPTAGRTSSSRIFAWQLHSDGRIVNAVLLDELHIPAAVNLERAGDLHI